jgi:hypothetical protein
MWLNNGKIKVLFLTKKDNAGSGLHLVNAINECSEKYQARLVSLSIANFGAKNDIICKSRKELQNMINSCDIVHLKGDDPIDTYGNLKFNKKPIFQTVGGSNFRQLNDKYISEVSTGKYALNRFRSVNLSGITPELTNLWIPHAFNPIENIWKKPNAKEKIRIGHSPSDRVKKGTEIIIEAVKSFDNVELVLMENMTNSEVIEAKKNIHIFIDQIMIDAYGMSAVECLSMGIPVISNCLELENCPIYRVTECNFESVKNAIEKAIKQLTKATSDKFFKYAIDTHSYKSVCEKLESFYSLKYKYYNESRLVEVVFIKDIEQFKEGQIITVSKQVANQLIIENYAKYNNK